MPTTITKSIGSAGGRDYATVALFIAALPASRVTADEIWIGECYNDSEFTSGSSFGTIGGTSDATRYVILRAAAGQSAFDNASVRTNALRYNAANGVAFRCTGSPAEALLVTAQYTRIEGLQFRTSNVGATATLSITGANCTVRACLAQTNGSVDASPFYSVVSGGSTYVNCISVWENTSASNRSWGFRTGDQGSYVHCTAIHTTGSTSGTSAGFHGNSSAIKVRDCAVFGFMTFAASFTAAANSGNNCGDDATGANYPGSSNQTGKVTANQFTDISLATLDLRAKTGADLINNGVTDASANGIDISGFTRSATPTIGAWEFSAAAGAEVLYMDSLIFGASI